MYFFSLELHQVLVLQFVQQSRQVDACLVNQSGQVLHGYLKGLFTPLGLASQRNEVDKLLVQVPDVVVPYFFIRSLSPVAEDVQEVQPENLILVQFGEEVRLVDGQYMDGSLCTIASRIAGIHAEQSLRFDDERLFQYFRQ